ncbi:porin PorA family protein [Nocardia sp. KC 131]|uniref:porin PorA family protein n=1 Tax=Nocardia arseniciresistens TaxID=3392119 RepID=UPI00398ED37D
MQVTRPHFSRRRCHHALLSTRNAPDEVEDPACGYLPEQYMNAENTVDLPHHQTRRWSRRSIGVGVLALAALIAAGGIRFALYPQLSKLPDDFETSMSMDGAMESLVPATMTLGKPEPARVERGLAVDAVHGDTAVLHATTRIQRPDGELKTEFRYAIDRATFRQKAAPGGVDVTNQRGGVVLARSIGSDRSPFAMYDPLIDRTVRLEHVADRDMKGRSSFEFKGLLDAPIVNSAVLAPVRTAIAKMATVGDGTTMPLLAVQAIAPRLPLEYRDQVQRILPELPNEVMLSYVSHTVYTVVLDEQLSVPLFLAQDQTTLLAINTGYSTIPMLPLTRLSVQTTPDSISDVVDTASALGRTVTISRDVIPVSLAVIGATILACIVLASRIRRRRQRNPA